MEQNHGGICLEGLGIVRSRRNPVSNTEIKFAAAAIGQYHMCVTTHKRQLRLYGHVAQLTA